MAVLAKSKLNFNNMEYLDDSEVEEILTSLRSDLEEYANGGFDLIRSKREETPEFFQQNEHCFLDLLELE